MIFAGNFRTFNLEISCDDRGFATGGMSRRSEVFLCVASELSMD